jgi:hypothetical protein
MEQTCRKEFEVALVHGPALVAITAQTSAVLNERCLDVA